MVDATHKSFPASDRSYFAILKKEVHGWAVANDFDKKRIGELDIVLAEMTSNLHKYANDGEVLAAVFREEENTYIELICIDSGPGMTDIVRMTTDGYSSGKTMGHGLGSIKRLSDHAEIFSQQGWGTIVLSRIYKTPPPAKAARIELLIKALVVAKPGEQVSGDGYCLKTTRGITKLLIADGLGHGPDANLAINEAAKIFRRCPEDSPAEILRDINREVRKTRGLVATIASFDLKNKNIRIAGIGNISSRFTSPALSKNCLAYNGIVGHNIPNTMNDQVIDPKVYNQLVMCSDGIRSRWDTNRVPGIQRSDLSIQAAAIYKDYARKTDDMSVIIAKFSVV